MQCSFCLSQHCAVQACRWLGSHPGTPLSPQLNHLSPRPGWEQQLLTSASFPLDPHYVRMGLSKMQQSHVMPSASTSSTSYPAPSRRKLPCPPHLSPTACQPHPSLTCPPSCRAGLSSATGNLPFCPARSCSRLTHCHLWEAFPSWDRVNLGSSQPCLGKPPALPFSQVSTKMTVLDAPASLRGALPWGRNPMLSVCMSSSPQTDLQQVLKKICKRVKWDGPPRKPS